MKEVKSWGGPRVISWAAQESFRGQPNSFVLLYKYRESRQEKGLFPYLDLLYLYKRKKLLGFP